MERDREVETKACTELESEKERIGTLRHLSRGETSLWIQLVSENHEK